MKKNIYVLDDDPQLSEVIDVILSNVSAYQVQFFETAIDFKAQVDQKIPDVILMDIKLPDGDGRHLCEDLKSDLHTQHIPIILMSGYPITENVRRTSFADDFISKPFDVEDFLERVENCLL